MLNLSIIIINWNSSIYLRECIRSIYRSLSGISFEIIVVDNASYDGCGEMLASEFPDVAFIQSNRNLGFSRGNNLAAKRARGEFMLFLNPDTKIDNGALNRLYEAISLMPHVGVAGARLLNGDGSLQTSCIQTFPTVSNQLLDADYLRKLFPRASIWGTALLFSATGPVEVEGISGACLMTRSGVFREVGGFSQDYFMYYEDMDYCLRVNQAGMKNLFVPNAVVVHYGGKSGSGSYSRFATVMMVESAWRFLLKFRGPHHAIFFRIGLAAKAVSRFWMLAFLFALRRTDKRGLALLKWARVLSWCIGNENWLRSYSGRRV